MVASANAGALAVRLPQPCDFMLLHRSVRHDSDTLLVCVNLIFMHNHVLIPQPEGK